MEDSTGLLSHFSLNTAILAKLSSMAEPGDVTPGIRMAEPAEYSKYVYPDYPRARTLPTLAKYFRKHEPDYYDAVSRHIGAHGVKEPVLLRHSDPGGRPLKRPIVMGGHHRAAAAFEQGKPIPVGDYDNDEHHKAGDDFAQSWWRDHHELKESYTDPRSRTAATRPVEPASRPGRHQEHCECCHGTGNHHDGSRCERCEGSGAVVRGTREPNCPDQPSPKRRHWREPMPRKAARQREGDERPYGGYTMRYRTDDLGERKPRHIIETFHPDGSRVGELNWYGTTGCVHHVGVADGAEDGSHNFGNGQNHMHQGIAAAMWDWSQEMTPKARHSGDRTDAGKGWVKSLSRPRKDPPEIEAHPAPEPEQHTAAAETRDSQLAEMDPHTRASALAQDHVRCWHPVLTRQLDSGESADHTLRHWLGQAGHPRADEAYVVKHRDPSRGTSNTARGPDGEPAVALHQERYDYGTLAHETAHLLVDHETGRPVNGPPAEPEGVHGPRWAAHYTRLLNNVSRDAGEDYQHERGQHLEAEGLGDHTAALEATAGAVGFGELDQHLEDWFHPQQLDAERVTHPRSGYQVEKGEQRRVHHPDEGEGPAHFEIWDHGEPGVTNALAYPKRVRSEPVQHVYRGVSAEEWKQARQRGHVQSDQRGTISDWEGTNAAADPRSAVSYLPRNAPGHVLKIRVHPDDGWFTHNVDQYLRTRKPVPLDRVEGVSPSIFKGGKYGNEIQVGEHEPMEHTAAAPYEIRYDLDHHGRHRVSAWPSGHQGETAQGKATPLGALHWHPDDGEVTYMRVEDGHRRQGMGTALWQRAHRESAERGLTPPAHSQARTPAGTGFAEGVGGHLPPLDRESRERDWSGDGEEYQHRPRTAALEATVSSHLDNPLTGGSDWFHGTQASREELGRGFEDPASISPEAYEDPEVEPTGHWNALLGTHFAASHDLAQAFAGGEHSSGNNDRGEDAEPAVVHARLSIRNPMVYGSEHDLDDAVYEFAMQDPEHRLGALLPDDEEDREDSWPRTAALHGIYGDEEIPRGARSQVPMTFGVPSDQPDRTEWLNGHPHRFDIAAAFKEHLAGQGYDGIVYRNEYEKTGSDHPHADTSVIAFHPRQIEVACHHDADEDDAPEPVPHTAALEGVHCEHTAAAEPEPEVPSFTWKYTTYGPDGTYVDKEREVKGPFYHGGRSKNLREGDEITKGRKTNPWGDEGPKSQYAHFTTDLPGAASYASKAGGHVYEVHPTGEVKGGYTGDEYKSVHSLRVVRRLDPSEWQQHTATVAPAPAAPPWPMAKVEEAVTAIGSWSPQEPSDAREILEDLPGFFRAAARGLDSLSARLADETPLDVSIIDVLASMSGACHTAAGDADDILAHFRQVTATEGV